MGGDNKKSAIPVFSLGLFKIINELLKNSKKGIMFLGINVKYFRYRNLL